jgi:integrase
MILAAAHWCRYLSHSVKSDETRLRWISSAGRGRNIHEDLGPQREAGLQIKVFHELRHTCATIRSMKGQHLNLVSGLKAHVSVTLTLDEYRRVVPRLGDDNVIEDASK